MGLRLEILDELLGSIKRRNYEDLLDALNEKLVEHGDKEVSLRTLQYDISDLINKKDAPIHRPDKKDDKVYYTEKFTLKDIPLDQDDISVLKNAVNILRKATNIRLTKEVDEIISRLENRIHTNVPESSSMIAFEEHTEAKGKEYFEELFSAIKEKCPVKINYQPFGKEERELVVHPYMLKEYRNRWFLIGRVGNYKNVSNLALDRIKGKIKNCAEPFIDNDLFDPEHYFKNLIGVTLPSDQEAPSSIIIRVAPASAEYVRTKPLHKSQEILKKYKNGGLQIRLNVYINFELISYLLSYGVGIEIQEPVELRERLAGLVHELAQSYKQKPANKLQAG